MKLIVGLGNPGKKYNGTRHNVGFSVIDNYLGKVDWKERFNALVYEKKIGRQKILFIKPLSYMNLSGQVVKQYVDYYKINFEDILVIHDDIDLEVGKYKIKCNSSSAGHNGIGSIIEWLNTASFLRIKVGVSRVEKEKIVDYVLGKFSVKDKKTINDLQLFFDETIDQFIENKLNK